MFEFANRFRIQLAFLEVVVARVTSFALSPNNGLVFINTLWVRGRVAQHATTGAAPLEVVRNPVLQYNTS